MEALEEVECSSTSGLSLLPAKYVKRSRINTLKEKCRMRNERKKRKRLQRKKPEEKKIQALKESCDKERLLRSQSEKKVLLYRNMSRSYWERWNWELQQRKEAVENVAIFRTTSAPATILHEIELSMLKEPRNVSEIERWAGRGSFGVVKIYFYRGIKVVSKELLPKTVLEDVKNEAAILTKLCHPYLPYLFGVCTNEKPYRIVMQFHGIGSLTYTLSKSLSKDGLQLNGMAWLSLCAQLVEAIRYLHNDAHVLHNDIKGTNILLSQSVSTKTDPQLGDDHVRVQAVLIDFGMATVISGKKRLRLTENEKADYRVKYPHIAPEIIEGHHQLSPQIDIFSLGSVLYKCIDNECFNDVIDVKTAIISVADRCHNIDCYKRPTATAILEKFQCHKM